MLLKRPLTCCRLAGWLGGRTKTPTIYFQPEISMFSTNFTWTDEAGRRHKIWISRRVEKPMMKSDATHVRDPESITLSVWWTRKDSAVLR